MKGEWHFQGHIRVLYSHLSNLGTIVCIHVFFMVFYFSGLKSNVFLMGCCHAALVTVPALKVVSWDREVTHTLLYL